MRGESVDGSDAPGGEGSASSWENPLVADASGNNAGRQGLPAGRGYRLAADVVHVASTVPSSRREA